MIAREYADAESRAPFQTKFQSPAYIRRGLRALRIRIARHPDRSLCIRRSHRHRRLWPRATGHTRPRARLRETSPRNRHRCRVGQDGARDWDGQGRRSSDRRDRSRRSLTRCHTRCLGRDRRDRELFESVDRVDQRSSAGVVFRPGDQMVGSWGFR